MNVAMEFRRSEGRIRARINAGAREAERRIEAFTPLEWAEVVAGVREHPEAAAARKSRARNAAAGEQLGRAVRAFNDGMMAFFAAFDRGYREGGL